MMTPLSRPVLLPVMRHPCDAGMIRRPDLTSNIAALFGSKPMCWYTPDDPATLFQDVAGTIPVTAVGQSVALMKDISGRNNHVSQSAAGSRPIFTQAPNGKYCLQPDGVDDSMFSASINLSAYSQMVACMGAMRTDLTTAIVVEFSPASTSSNGSFAITSANTGTSVFRSRGTSAVTVNVPWAANVPKIITGQADISADMTKIVGDGWQTATSSNDQGSPPYGTWALNLFRRNNASSPFKGYFFGLIVLAGLSSDADVSTITAYMNSKTGAY